jgi:hypothetical protein
MEETNDCVICWDCIDINNSYQKWNCSHRFHRNCAESWNNGCPTCRNRTLFDDGLGGVRAVSSAFLVEGEPVTWSISRNPRNVLDLSRMLQTNILPVNLEYIYKNLWKDQECIGLDHKLWYFDNYGVQAICENCNTIQCYNRMH